MTGSREELAAAVRRRAQGTPYVLDETPEGFDVRLDVADPEWFGLLREWRLTQASTSRVEVRQASRSIVIAEELQSLTWRAGPDGRERPTLGATLEVSSGRVRSRRTRRTYAVGRGGAQQESAISFDSSAGRALVVDAAKEQGWKLERSLDETIGLSVGITTIALLVLAGLVVGIVALAGGFS